MTNTANAPKTPGFNQHLEIWFKVTKTGRKRAFFFSTRTFRAHSLPLADAELWIATGLATSTAGHPFQ